MKQQYPFTAIVGQDELMLAILLNLINPEIGGVLIKGAKGSGKSTAVYAIPDIAPRIDVVKYCDLNCDPDFPEEWCEDCQNQYPACCVDSEEKQVEIISIPLSVTEDRLLGSIDLEHLLKDGDYRFIPGLIARAHRQILYIDEVNLLPDHIVDDILDVAASGINRVERENFSREHLAEFLMIGTMNPEEGELRPQILDRFPLSVTLKVIDNPALRKEIVARNLAFKDDPTGFRQTFEEQTDFLRNTIAMARDQLQLVQVGEAFYDAVVAFCAAHEVDGHRADITIIRTAQTHAALELRDEVELRHIIQAAKLVLPHRTRKGGLSKPLTLEEIEASWEKIPASSSSTTTAPDINPAFTLFREGGLILTEKK
jgi:Mg-chelatase subunit ChlI